MKSPGHRKNLLSAAYTELGTGYATDDAGARRTTCRCSDGRRASTATGSTACFTTHD